MQSKLVRLSYSGIVLMIVITSPASDVWRVQSKDPRLLSFVVKVVLAMDPNAVNAFSKPLRYSVGSMCSSNTSMTPLAMLAMSRTPSQNSMMSPTFSAVALVKAKISFLSFSPGTATCSKKSLYATLPQSLVTLKAKIHFPGPAS